MTQQQSNKSYIISLFCGPGGFDQGFKDAGFQVGLAYDAEPSCVNTHRKNHPEAITRCLDLSSPEAAAVIISDWKSNFDNPPSGVVGGPPCQSFSSSNVHRKSHDPKDTLPRCYAHILSELNITFNLDFFVFENVPGILDCDHIYIYNEFKSLAEDAGFILFRDMLDAQHFGVPQMRKRLFIIGLNKERYSHKFRFPQPNGQPMKTVGDAIGHLDEPVYFSRKLTPEEIATRAGHPNHWCMRPRSSKFTSGELEPGKIKGRCFRVLDSNRPSYTVAYGNREVHVHPMCHRRLSVYEAMLLQSFPERYVLEGTLSEQISMVSDAVAPPVAKAIALAIKEQLRLSNKERLKLSETVSSQNGQLPLAFTTADR